MAERNSGTKKRKGNGLKQIYTIQRETGVRNRQKRGLRTGRRVTEGNQTRNKKKDIKTDQNGNCQDENQLSNLPKHRRLYQKDEQRKV
jgi:hypothetical protein